MDLYSLPPEDFTRVRDEQVRAARAAKDRDRAGELAALRRPTVSAYAVNALVRAEPGLLDQLVELGAALAQAQTGRDAGALRELGEQRRALVEAVADRAADAAGRVLGATARAEVVSTLEAVLADPASGQVVRSGRLVRALSYAGFGGVDLAGAVGGDVRAARAPATSENAGDAAKEVDAAKAAAAQAVAVRRQQRLAAARQAALEAAGRLDDAVRAASRAEEVRARDQAAVERETARVAAVEQELATARADRDESAQALRRSGRELDRAHDAVREAQAGAERARAAARRLGAD